MKVRKTVIVDKDVWWELKRKSFELGKTLADYLDGVLRSAIYVPPDDSDWKEGTADPPVSDPAVKTIREKKIERVKGRDLSPKISDADKDMLEKAQEMIKKKRPASMTGWTGGYSKERQVGKKGAK